MYRQGEWHWTHTLSGHILGRVWEWMLRMGYLHWDSTPTFWHFPLTRLNVLSMMRVGTFVWLTERDCDPLPVTSFMLWSCFTWLSHIPFVLSWGKYPWLKDWPLTGFCGKTDKQVTRRLALIGWMRLCTFDPLFELPSLKLNAKETWNAC